MNRLDKLKKELKDPSLHFRHECEGFRCGAHKSWEEGFDAASAEYEKIIAELENDMDKILAEVGTSTLTNKIVIGMIKKLKEFRG